MQPEVRPKRLESVANHPVAELLACPPSTSTLLTASARTIDFESGYVVFRQSSSCLGLYLIISGQLLRRADRIDMRVTLGTARPGDLVEIAAALGDRIHTYTLVAQSPGSVLILPVDALQQAFQSYPPLRMKLLEELAREVSRAYHLCTLFNPVRPRRRAPATPAV
jgi:CRP-like cAMP-binding protein